MRSGAIQKKKLRAHTREQIDQTSRHLQKNTPSHTLTLKPTRRELQQQNTTTKKSTLPQVELQLENISNDDSNTVVHGVFNINFEGYSCKVKPCTSASRPPTAERQTRRTTSPGRDTKMTNRPCDDKHRLFLDTAPIPCSQFARLLSVAAPEFTKAHKCMVASPSGCASA